jgi:peptide/nickel transport system substrate-binding protein
MKRSLVFLVIALLIVISIVGCSSSPTTSVAPVTTTTASSTTASTTTLATSATTTSAASQPVKGGILRVIRNESPMYFGYPPNNDGFCRVFNTERLINWDAKGNIIPELASSWDVDTANKTITWHIQKGVKFQDGTDFNAEAARWNMQTFIDLNLQTDAKKIKSIEVVDTYTLKETLTEITSQAVLNFGWVQMFSPTALKTNGEEWGKTHEVGTGPFEFVDWERDNYANFKRFDNYWRGPANLDGIKIIVIPDPVTASSMMQAGQADMWVEPPTKFAVELASKGLNMNWGLGYFWALWPNSTDTNSKFANKTVREALEYAIDRPSMAKTIGFGQYEALTQIVPKNSAGYVSGFDPRPFNPEKAKQLLKDAGYPNGFETTLLCSPANQDVATALQGYLGKVGIKVNLDIADMGRYYTQLMSGFFGGGQGGFTDLAVGFVGIDLPAITGIIRHLGPTPMTGILGINGAKSPEFLGLIEKALQTFDTTQLTAVTEQIVKQASSDALIVPLFRAPYGSAMQKYVHSDYELQHGVVWYCYKDWMEKH